MQLCKRTACSPACTKCCCTQKCEEAVSYAQAAYVAASLINKSVEELDWVRISPLFDASRHRPTKSKNREFCMWID